ncbi:MAG: 50S ribosomal protein L4 [Candidatus Omnitrophica bacterium]|nr:50S ribosomal protein L4 [Candidatus Omnitrophota bacterium]
MFSVPLYNPEGKEIDTVKLDEQIFNDKIFPSSVYRTIVAFRSNQRKGLASTKTRGEVAGGGRKPWKQKGTGRARAGSTRSPLWRHGGVVFGPHPRDFELGIPRKMKESSLRFALSQKAAEQNIVVLDRLPAEQTKTKDLAAMLRRLKLDTGRQKLLLVLPSTDPQIRRAGKNIGHLEIDIAANINTYEVMAAEKLIITRDGLAQIAKRLK